MKTLVLGIGNILIGDEGAGVFFVNYFKKNLAPCFFLKEELAKFPGHQVIIMDGGTMAMNLSHIISNFDKVYVVDCIDSDDLEVGDVVFFDYKDIPANINYQGSAHELEMNMTLNFMSMLGDLPECKILGIVPNRLEPMKIGLSDEVKATFSLLKDKLLEELKKDGYLLKWQDSLSIDDSIRDYEKINHDN